MKHSEIEILKGGTNDATINEVQSTTSSQTIAKPNVMRRIGVSFIATHYLDDDNSIVFKSKEDAVFFCTEQDTNFRWVERPLYGA